MNTKLNRFLKTLGPGILFATTCVGVSHLVQSTRAGANYGFLLLGVIILINIIKYPFFEFASRYTNATGKSILDGYYKKSPSILILYLVITIFTMFIVSAAVVFVTAGLVKNLIPIPLTTLHWVIVLLCICAAILIIGKFNILDSLLKVIGTVLVISTLGAFFSALYNYSPPALDFIPKSINNKEGLIFIIALMGWMPTAVDLSAWNSIWTEERIKQTKYHPTLKETILDFNLGYWISAILAIFFLSLGALIIYGTNTGIKDKSAEFASQLINMYTSAIGSWSYYVIAIAAFSTMFSTTITVMDGYCRSLTRTVTLLRSKKGMPDSKKTYMTVVAALTIGATLVCTLFIGQLKSLVDFATIVSFLIAPLIAFLNYKIIFAPEVPDTHRPPIWKKRLAQFGIGFLLVFACFFFIVKIF